MERSVRQIPGLTTLFKTFKRDNSPSGSGTRSNPPEDNCKNVVSPAYSPESQTGSITNSNCDNSAAMDCNPKTDCHSSAASLTRPNNINYNSCSLGARFLDVEILIACRKYG